MAFSEKIPISLELKDFLIIPKVLYCSISELGLYEANLAKTLFSPRYGTLKFRYLWVLSLKWAFSEKIPISLELKDFLIIPKVLYYLISELGLYEANLAKTLFS